MKLKDLKVGQKVWFSTSREELRKGGGEQVTIVAMGRYTRTWEPCGSLITPTTAPGSTMVVLKFPKEVKGNSLFARFGSESSPQQFRLNDGGRYLLHESEHKIMRDARADRELEVEAHQQRGQALVREVTTTIRKAMGDLGFPTELMDLRIYSRNQYNSKRKKYARKFELSVDIKDEKVLELVMSPGLQAQINDYHRWVETPKPGTVC